MTNDIDNLEALIPNLSPALSDLFKQYFEMISHYNTKINLISKGTVPHSVVKHFSDCYFGLKSFLINLELETPIFDFGSGNGFPGIIAAMMLPNQKIILVERDQRKAEFLRIASAQLNLPNIEVYAGSINHLKDGSVQRAISRAMAPLPKFLLETRESVDCGGKIFLFKGEHWMRELSGIPPQLFDFWNVELESSYLLADKSTERFIIRCERIQN